MTLKRVTLMETDVCTGELDARVEDVAFLVGWRTDPGEIARRLHAGTPNALAQHMRKAGRNDLAKYLTGEPWK